MSFKNCVSQVIKLGMAVSATVALPKLLIGMKSAFRDFLGVAVRAGDTF